MSTAPVGPTLFEIPAPLRTPLLGLEAWQWFAMMCVGLVAWLTGRILAFLLLRIALRITKKTTATWDDGVLDALRPPSRFFFTLVAFNMQVGVLSLPQEPAVIVARTVDTITIGAVGWTLVRLVGVLATYLEQKTQTARGSSDEDRLRARGVETFVRVVRRIVTVSIGIVTAALMLTRFESARNAGVSLLASAGLAGVVLGFAAQRTFGSLIAGIQLSATQPIRIGDVVVIEKEWGTIEEITLTYVVVKIWDERRLIVPMTRFLEAPFENWTKTSSEVHGTITVFTDWTIPVDALRKEAFRLIEQHPAWDGRTKSVDVTGATERTLEVRVLVSASDASNQWKLRVEIREALVRWLQAFDGGRYLPRLRLDEGRDG